MITTSKNSAEKAEGMEIDQEEAFVPADTLEKYIASYSGHGKFHILLRLARNSVIHREKALKLCVDLAKQEKKLKYIFSHN